VDENGAGGEELENKWGCRLKCTSMAEWIARSAPKPSVIIIDKHNFLWTMKTKMGAGCWIHFFKIKQSEMLSQDFEHRFLRPPRLRTSFEAGIIRGSNSFLCGLMIQGSNSFLCSSTTSKQDARIKHLLCGSTFRSFPNQAWTAHALPAMMYFRCNEIECLGAASLLSPDANRSQ
jgi:hypothetical protein